MGDRPASETTLQHVVEWVLGQSSPRRRDALAYVQRHWPEYYNQVLDLMRWSKRQSARRRRP